MSGPVLDPKVKLRRLTVRAGMVIVYVILVAVVFVFGKSHTLLVDNKDAADGSYTAINGVMVSVDGAEALEMYPGDRDMAHLKGQSHSVKVEVIADGTKVAKHVTLPIDQDMLILSVPRLLKGIEPFVEPFEAKDVAPPPANETVGDTNSFTAPGGVPEPAPAVPGSAAPAVAPKSP